MRKTMLVLAALATMSGAAFAKDVSGKLPLENQAAAETRGLDYSATGSVRHQGKLLPLKLKGGATTDPAKPSGIEVNPFFPNPH